jgi:glycosyltransferase involved in cell wall biosynthesis
VNNFTRKFDEVIKTMKVAINQIRGNSGVDVWAQNLCRGLQDIGVSCNLDLLPTFYQFCPSLIPFRKTIHSDTDIIQSHTWNGFGFRNKTPLVVTEHGVLHDPLLTPYKSLGQKLFHRHVFRFEQKSLDVADAVTCVSQFTQKKLESVFDYHDSIVIYNGIDTGLFKPTPVSYKQWNVADNKKILFFSGTPSSRKGADLLPKIMDLLGDEYLLLIASGARRGNNWGRTNIRNLGNLNIIELIAIYSICDIFLFPSRLEGFGLSVAEAMSCGKPVVATDCSSLPELVEDGKGGFLCRMDDVNDFAEKIRHLAADEDLRREMGSFNRKRVEEKFEISRMVREYVKLYNSL